MKSLSKAVLSALLVTAVTSPVTDAQQSFDQIITFGASFEDVGQFPDIDFGALAGLVPPPGAGLDGSTGFRLTNLDPGTGSRGRVWVEWLAEDLGIGGHVPSTPILIPGERTDIPDTSNINFAFATARNGDMYSAVVGESAVEHPVNEYTELDLTATGPGFAQRLASGDLALSSRALFVVNPAGNDVRDVSLEDPAGTGVTAARNSMAIISSLLELGAETIVSPTFPALGLFSESANVAPDGSRTEKAEARIAAAAAYNEEMARGLPDLGGNIVILDINRLFVEMLAEPGTFGFNPRIDHSRYCYSSSEWTMTSINCTEAEGLGKSSGGDPGDFILNDGLHPTQASHQIMADYTASILRAPGMVALMPEVVLADARAYGNTLSDYQIRRRWSAQPEGWDVFTSMQWERTDYDNAMDTPAANSKGVDHTFGASYTLNPNWFVGAALGTQSSKVEFDRSGSEFETRALLASLFAGYRSQHIFSDLSLTVGSSDVEDIRRVVPLGQRLVRVERGETEADIQGAAVIIGVDVMADDSVTRFGPFLSLDYLSIEVDGFAENGTTSTAMTFGEQERDSLLGSAGIFARHGFSVGKSDLEVYGDISYRDEFENGGESVEAVVKNLSSGVHFQMPGYDIDNESVVLRAGISGNTYVLRWNLFASYEENDPQTSYLGFGIAYDL